MFICFKFIITQKLNLPSFSVEDASKKHPFPCPTTYRTALLHYVDITSTVKTNVLTELQDHAKGEDKTFLYRICDTTEEAKVSDLSICIMF